MNGLRATLTLIHSGRRLRADQKALAEPRSPLLHFHKSLVQYRPVCVLQAEGVEAWHQLADVLSDGLATDVNRLLVGILAAHAYYAELRTPLVVGENDEFFRSWSSLNEEEYPRDPGVSQVQKAKG